MIFADTAGQEAEHRTRLAWMEQWPRSHPRTTGRWTLVRRGGWATLDPETGRVQPAVPEHDRRLPGLGPALAAGGHLVAYRVGRRAVVADGDHWVKVVRPSRVTQLVATHSLLDTGLGRVGVETPRVLSRHDDGRLALSTVPGRSLHRILRDSAPFAVRNQASGQIEQTLVHVAAGLVELHRIPPTDPTPLPSPDHPEQAIGWVARVEPTMVERLESVAATLPERSNLRPDSMTHGDLHDKNVFVGADGRPGLIDLDGVGPGSSIDDVANLAVHLELRALQAGLDHTIGQGWSRCLTDAYARFRSLDPDELSNRRRHTWFRLACLYRLRQPGRELTDRLLDLAVDDR